MVNDIYGLEHPFLDYENICKTEHHPTIPIIPIHGHSNYIVAEMFYDCRNGLFIPIIGENVIVLVVPPILRISSSCPITFTKFAIFLP